MSVTLARIYALEQAARSQLMLILEIRKELESERPAEDEATESSKPDDGQDPCPADCVARYRVATPVMGHPTRTKCRMCGRTYD